jgi:hypothetical protein
MKKTPMGMKKGRERWMKAGKASHGTTEKTTKKLKTTKKKSL